MTFTPCRPNNFVTHRVYTPEEAIGKIVIFNGDDIGWIQITATDCGKAYGNSCMGPWSETYEMLLDRYVTNEYENCGMVREVREERKIRNSTGTK